AAAWRVGRPRHHLRRARRAARTARRGQARGRRAAPLARRLRSGLAGEHRPCVRRRRDLDRRGRAAVNLDALARGSGTFLMVAMDQRESLRTMLAQHQGDVDDAQMVRFKLAVARELGPLASGFLIDRRYGFDEVVAQRLLPSSCGLILAADALEQPSGGIVEDTDLDEG